MSDQTDNKCLTCAALQQRLAQLEKALADAAKVEALIVAADLLPKAKFDQAREIVRMSR